MAPLLDRPIGGPHASEDTCWLTQLTGKTYRIPNKGESKALHKSARKAAPKGNTLNYWAGYNLVPSDYKQLKEKLKSTK